MSKKRFLTGSGLFMAMGAFHIASAAPTMPTPVKTKIERLNTAPGQSCIIVSFFPAYYGQVQGIAGDVAVGTIDRNPENCGGMAPPEVSVVVYVISGGHYRQVEMPASIIKLQQPQIISVVPRDGGLTLHSLFRGPGDPLCCAEHKSTDWVPLQQKL